MFLLQSRLSFWFALLVSVLALVAVSAAPAPPAPPAPAAPAVPAQWSPGSAPQSVWIGDGYDEILTDADRQYFKPNGQYSYLKGVNLDHQITAAEGGQSANSMGVWTMRETYEGHNGKDLIVKGLNNIDDKAFSEIKALKVVGDFVDAGMVAHMGDGEPEAQKVPVIITKKKPGTPLHKSPEFRAADENGRKKMVVFTLKRACSQVADMAMDKNLYHYDNHMGNVLVTFKRKKVDQVSIIDYGPLAKAAGIYTVKNVAGVTKADVIDACLRNWGALWLSAVKRTPRPDENPKP